ncbi:MAG TPA: EAL domain-containing response regulator [Gammaproteobacteria bacterium]
MTGRVLILDDDAAVGETIRFVAESADMEARSVTAPDEFFTTVDEWRPTHIVLDLIMPEMDGVEIMRHLAERRCDAHIIILSGVGNRVLDAARRTAAEKGLRISGVLSKPISPKDLREFLSDGPAPVKTATTATPRKPRTLEITEDDLRTAIDEKQFIVYYQPKIHCGSGQVSGFEALVRWKHPTLGMVMPDAFIPLAERLNLIGEVTTQILDEAMHWMRDVRNDMRLSLSVNLSAKALGDIDLADRLAKRCRDAGIDPDRLILELTETTAMDDPVLALDLVTRLRMKGFHVSIDDVGTGYSSMAQLARLPFSEMKVDKSFVMTAAVSKESRSIISSFIDLGHKLDLRVVAEGVEDKATLDFLHRTGCDFVQGFFIARPMPGELVSNWIDNRHH